MKKNFLSIPAALLLGSGLWAETASLAPLSVVSSAFEESELASTASVEIYTAEDIAEAHVQSIYEFLNLKSSVVTMPGYGNPFMQKIDMGGYGIGDGYQNIVVTVNGRRMNNMDMVPQLLASIPPSSIERIEIVKGGGSVESGDGANAGAIHIVTKKGDQGEVSVFGGNYDTYSGAFRYAKTGEKAAFNVSGESYRTGGTRIIDAQGSGDAQKLTNGRAELTLMPTDALELFAAGQFSKSDVTYAGYLSQLEYDSDPQQAGAFNWGATQQKYDSVVAELGARYDIGAHWALSADASREKKKSVYVAWNSVAHSLYDSAKLALDYKGDAFAFKTGGEYRKGERTAAVRITKENLAGFGTAQYRLDRNSFTAGYRYETVSYDNHNAFTKEHTLQGFDLGYSLQLTPEHALYVRFAHAFQSADVDRMFSFFSGAFTGFVEPSESETYTLGYRYITPALKVKTALFYSGLKNEIYYYADPLFVNSKNTNIDRSYKYGADLFAQWRANGFDLTLNYNYVKAIIDEELQNGEDFSGKELPGVANHSVKAGIAYRFAHGSTLSLSEVYRSEAYAANDFGNDFLQKQDEYHSTDLAYTFSADNYELFAKINNLFDQKNGIWVQDDTIYPVNFTRTYTAGLTLRY